MKKFVIAGLLLAASGLLWRLVRRVPAQVHIPSAVSARLFLRKRSGLLLLLTLLGIWVLRPCPLRPIPLKCVLLKRSRQLC